MIARDLLSNQTRGIMATHRDDDLIIRRECVVRMSWDPLANKTNQQEDERERDGEKKDNRTTDAVRYFPCVIVNEMKGNDDSLSSNEDVKEQDNLDIVDNTSPVDQEKQLGKETNRKKSRYQVLQEGFLCSHDLSSLVIAQNCSLTADNQNDVCIFHLSMLYDLLSTD